MESVTIVAPYHTDVKQHYDALLASLRCNTTVKLLPFVDFLEIENLLVRNDGSLPDVVITHDGFSHGTVLSCKKWMDLNVPVLLLMDGILEWRNSWDHPRQNSTGETFPMYQPAIAHKIACIGHSQARVLESWGNLDKCEVVGAPRFDSRSQSREYERGDGNKFRLLVSTARNPAFTQRQEYNLIAALKDIKEWCESNRTISGKELFVRWRIGQKLINQLELPDNACDPAGQELVVSLRNSDALISTPSTVMLEGMLEGLPVALLDFHHTPQYVPAAWTICSSKCIGDTVRDMMIRPPERMLYQDFVLYDSLECKTPATTRLTELVKQMVTIGRQCNRAKRPLQLPPKILSFEDTRRGISPNSFDLSALFPQEPDFGISDCAVLQTELAHLRAEHARLLRELKEIKKNNSDMEIYRQLELIPILGYCLRINRKVVSILARKFRNHTISSR